MEKTLRHYEPIAHHIRRANIGRAVLIAEALAGLIASVWHAPSAQEISRSTRLFGARLVR